MRFVLLLPRTSPPIVIRRPPGEDLCEKRGIFGSEPKHRGAEGQYHTEAGSLEPLFSDAGDVRIHDQADYLGGFVISRRMPSGETTCLTILRDLRRRVHGGIKSRTTVSALAKRTKKACSNGQGQWSK
jgi:hypothetical protein